MNKITGIAVATVMGITIAAASMSIFAAESTEIHHLDFDQAVETVMTDAGLTADEVTFSKKMNDFEDGIEVYEIDFLIPGETKFDYKINATTGEVIEKEAEAWEANDDAEYKALLDAKANYFDFYSDEAVAVIASSMMNALEETAPANEIDVLYYKTGMEFDNGMILYKVGIMIPNETKIEYEYDAATGELFKTEKDFWEAEDDIEYAFLLNAEAQAAAEPAEAQAAAVTEEVTEEAAKAIALENAGFDESEVTITRCAKDLDDGIEKIDVEFIGPDGKEYDYEISTADGSIFEKDAEYDD